MDRSLTAAIAADGMATESVTEVAMPTRFSLSLSLEEAEHLAKIVGIKSLVLPIDQVFQAFLDMLGATFGGHSLNVTEKNLQNR